MRSTSVNLSNLSSLGSFGLLIVMAAGCPVTEESPTDDTTAATGSSPTGTTEEAPSTGDPTAAEPTTGEPGTGESTDETDETSGSSETGETGETGETTGTATTGDPGVAMIRFVNISDGGDTRYLIDDQPAAQLYFTQSQHYQPFPAGSHDVSTTDTEEGAVLSSLIGYEFEAGQKYTVTGMGLHGVGSGNPTMWVNVDVAADAVDVPASHTRLTLINATPDSEHGIYAQLDYDNEFFIDFYNEHDMKLLEYVQQVTVDCPYPTQEQFSTLTLVGQWGVPPDTMQLWAGAALLQVANNESLYVFMTCTGACDSDEDRFVLAMMEDSTTFTIETK